MAEKITNTLIKNLMNIGKQYEIWDTDVKGLLVRMNVDGSSTYYCQYARGKKIKIAKTNIISPAQARKKALKILNNWNDGILPNAKRNPKKITLEYFLKEYYKPWALQHKKSPLKSLARIDRCFTKCFSEKELKDLTPAVIEQWRTNRLGNGISKETLNIDVATFKAAISKAVE